MEYFYSRHKKKIYLAGFFGLVLACVLYFLLRNRLPELPVIHHSQVPLLILIPYYLMVLSAAVWIFSALTFLIGVTRICPSCRKLWSKIDYGSLSINTETKKEKKPVKEEEEKTDNFDEDSPFGSLPDMSDFETVIIKDTRKEHYICRNCNNEWYREYTNISIDGRKIKSGFIHWGFLIFIGWWLGPVVTLLGLVLVFPWFIKPYRRLLIPAAFGRFDKDTLKSY